MGGVLISHIKCRTCDTVLTAKCRSAAVTAYASPGFMPTDAVSVGYEGKRCRKACAVLLLLCLPRPTVVCCSLSPTLHTT